MKIVVHITSTENKLGIACSPEGTPNGFLETAAAVMVTEAIRFAVETFQQEIVSGAASVLLTGSSAAGAIKQMEDFK